MQLAAPPRQLALALPHAESLAREDFLEGEGNRDALALMDRWPDWPASAIVVTGPEGAGKSHLSAIWAAASGARRLSARALTEADVPGALATGALVLEDVARGVDERAAFHLLNLAREQNAFVLLTAREPPAGILTLPDLRSRLRALPHVALAAPDERLLRAVMVKLFADRQIGAEEPLVSFLMTRLERSVPAVRDMVERLDREALQRRRPVSRLLAAELLNGLP